MTAYKDFIQDYPTRCGEVLESLPSLTNKEGESRDVTLLLCVASSSLMMPYDRLTLKTHPSGGGRHQQLSEAKLAVETALSKEFVSSNFWPKESASWKYGILLNDPKTKRPSSGPEAWRSELKDLNEVSPSLTVENVRNILRNGLAHGNVFLEDSDEINTLFVLAELRKDKSVTCGECGSIKKGFECVAVSPAHLRLFIYEWINLLKGLNIPEGTTWLVEQPPE